MKRYSLANHILSIKPNDPTIEAMFGTISIGGEGSYNDSIRIRRNNNMWDTTGYATGAWVHNKNLSRTGVVEISLNQLSDQVAKFITLCDTYYTGDYEGFTISLSKIDGNKIATALDCYITKVPDQEFLDSAQSQVWSFTCGQISYN